MAKVAPYHSTSPEDAETFHDDDECPVGRRIEPENLAYATGRGRDLCDWCASHGTSTRPETSG